MERPCIMSPSYVTQRARGVSAGLWTTKGQHTFISTSHSAEATGALKSESA